MPDAETTRRLIDALDVRRNAAIGFGAGLAVALLAYVYRVGELAGSVEATRGSPLLFAMLAFVLALSAGALVTAALTARSALRVAREADAHDGSD